MDNVNKQSPDDEQQIEHPPEPEPVQESNTRNVLHLADGQVGETETDEPMPRHVSFEMPSNISWQGTVECHELDEAKMLVLDMIESILPTTEPDKETSSSTLTPPTTSSTSYDDERLHRILRLLDRYTRNLEAIEEHMLSAGRESKAERQLSQQCELATQTLPLNPLMLDMTSAGRRINQDQQQQLQQQQQQLQRQQLLQQQQQQMEMVPPCERRHHIITISANSSTPFVTPAPPRTFMARIGRMLGNLAGALCLCLQVNKDCIFCLSFFIAFVISASFLTAFFYRTISLSTTPIRVPIDTVRATPVASANETASLRLNGGYYYIYNTHRQHFV